MINNKISKNKLKNQVNQSLYKENRIPKLSDYPINGFYGKFGGQYVPEILIPPLEELETAFNEFKNNKSYLNELRYLNENYGGRPTPIYFAKRLTNKYNVARIFLKREDLVHGGAHKFNNAIGQALLAKHLGKKRIIAETGAGQHGVAVAMAGALFGLNTEIYMGLTDIKRQSSNVKRMKLLGARVIAVKTGDQTLKDAVNEALRDWVQSVESTHYLIGSVVGPHPFPYIVRYFQSIIGVEIKHQFISQFNKLPDKLVACVGGGSNAAGTFYPFIEDDMVELIGVEAGGKNDSVGKNCKTLSIGRPGIMHGAYSYLLQDDNGQVQSTHSISAGLDYPGVGPEHSFWKSIGRVKYSSVTDQDAYRAFVELSKLEGIIPALESSHAIAKAIEIAKEMESNKDIVITLSGRGDKDLDIIGDKKYD